MHMHREVIKWIQSLDLSFQVKNPRRDLANGFVVAEILSRYDKDVSMHGIDTGSSMAKRLDNWQQIKKVLGRLQCKTVTWEMMTHTMEAREGSGKTLLEAMFTFLTKKKIESNPNFEGTKSFVATPAYQRPTAAKIMRDINDETCDRVAKLTGDLDENRRLEKNNTILQRHKEDVQVAKAVDPERCRPVPRPPTKDGNSSTANAANTSVAKERRQKTQVTKEMAVRNVDDTILKTFADRDAAEKEEAFRSGFSPDDDLATSLSRVCLRPLNNAGLAEQLDELCNSEPGDYFHKFVQCRNRIPVDARNATWSALLESSSNVAKLISQQPEQFVHLTIGFSFVFGKEAALAQAQASPDTSQALFLLSKIGGEAMNINPDVAATIVQRHLIPSMLCSLAIGTPTFVERMSLLLCSFTNCNHHDSIKRLIGWLEPSLAAPNSPSSDRFYIAVAKIMASVDFSLCFGGANLCYYYALSAINSSFTTTRACGLNMLKLLVGTDLSLVVNQLPHLFKLGSDQSWEVRINQLDVLGALHQQIIYNYESQQSQQQQQQQDEEAAAQLEVAVTHLDSIRTALEKTFTSFTKMSSMNKRLALRTTVPYLDPTNHPNLSVLFLNLFFSFEDDQKHHMLHAAPAQSLEQPPVEAVPGRAQTFYPIGAIYESWYAPALAQALSSNALSFSTLDILTLLEPLVLGQDLNTQRDFWMGIVQSVKDDILQPIFNPANCRNVNDKDLGTCAEMAYGIATKYYAELSGDAIDEGENFQDVQDQAVEWLQANL